RGGARNAAASGPLRASGWCGRHPAVEGQSFGSHFCQVDLFLLIHFSAASSGFIPSPAIILATWFWSLVVHLNFFRNLEASLPLSAKSRFMNFSSWLCS